MCGYILRWLIAASSPQETDAHTKMLVEHIERLGFRRMWRSECNVLTQGISFIRLSLDSCLSRAALTLESDITHSVSESFPHGTIGLT